jgi:hypothetical protein
MWILAFFTDSGEPALGLSPLVKVLDVATGLTVVNDENMVETGDGFYRYSFDAYEPSRDYAVICDSVTLSGAERYTYASSGEYAEVLNSIESTVGLVDIRTILLRKIQTNRLELDDGDTDNWVLYDDDKSTPFLTFSVKDKSGNLIVQQPHTPSRRGMADGDVCGSGISPSVEIYMRKSVYDPDDDGIVNVSEAVSDGIYTSTASGIKYSVDNAHHRCYLGTKCIDESGMGDQFVVKYDAATDRLIYGVTNISGTLSGTIPHYWLLDLDRDDHPQYVPTNGTRGFTSTVSGVYPVEDYHLTTKEYVDSAISGTWNQLLEILGQTKSGRENLNLWDTETQVNFGAPFDNNEYVLVIDLENTVDDPSSEYSITITEKSPFGFTVHYSGEIDSTNYYLNWYATLSGASPCSSNYGTLSGIRHSWLRGLDEDDHPQYHTDDRGDARYYTKQEILNIINQNKFGSEILGQGNTYTDVLFGSAFPSDDYSLVLSLENSVDAPSSEYALTITNKYTTGFRVHYSGEIDSNNYLLNWHATISGGLAGGNYIASLIADTSPELGGDLELGDYNIVLNTTPSGMVLHGYTVGWSGDVSTMRVDWNDTGVGCPLHMKSNGHWEQCTAVSGTTRMPCSAIALEEGTGSKKILWKGIIRKGAWSWTAGDVIYVSTVDGALASAAPNSGAWKQSIGIAIASDTIRFEPGFDPGYINS